MFKVAIVGKTNVGKTTLFNKFVGKKISITDNAPSITRDRKESSVEWRGIKMLICDTPGLEAAQNTDELLHKMMDQSMMAVDEAHVCLFVIDGRNGISDVDKSFAKMLRIKNKNVILLVNKAENSDKIQIYNDIFTLGIKEEHIVAISAEQNIGLEDIYTLMKKYHDEYQSQLPEIIPEEDEADLPEEEKSIKIAVIGRPNAGKSTLINKILGYNRLVADKTPGTTRDAITIDMEYNGHKIKIIDTAGIRKKINISEKIEAMSVEESFRAIDFAHVVILMIDVNSPFDHQDSSLIHRVVEEGRSIILCLNKWDCVEERYQKQKLQFIERKIISMGLEGVLGDFITMSAIQDENVREILKEAINRYNVWTTKISTSKLNDWLRNVLIPSKKPPTIENRPVKLKFINQIHVRPPCFSLSANFTNIPDQYIKYIRHKIAEDFRLYGSPIRITMNKAKNPFNSESVAQKKRFKK